MGLITISKDIKALYSAAKLGADKDREAYAQAVMEATASPITYVTNLEYIISSGVGLESFQEFKENYSLPLGGYRKLLECVEVAIEKAEMSTRVNKEPYEALKEWANAHLDKHQHLMAMFENYEGELDGSYLRVFYSEGFKDSAPAVLSKYGRAFVPDLLCEASEDQLPSMLQGFSESLFFNTPETKQWLFECARDLPSIDTSSDGGRFLYEGTLTQAIDGIIESKQSSFREAALTGEDPYTEYTLEGVSAIEQFVEFNQHLTTALRTSDAIERAAKVVFEMGSEFPDVDDVKQEFNSVAAMLPGATGKAIGTNLVNGDKFPKTVKVTADGVLTAPTIIDGQSLTESDGEEMGDFEVEMFHEFMEDVEIFTEAKANSSIKKVVTKLNGLRRDLLKDLKKEVREGVQKHNSGKGPKVPQPTVILAYTDGHKDSSTKAFLRRLVKSNKDDLGKGKGESTDIRLVMRFKIDPSPKNVQAAAPEVYIKAVRASLKPLLTKGVFIVKKQMAFGHNKAKTEFQFIVCISREWLMNGVDAKALLEATEVFTEERISHKRLGIMPKYLHKHHKMPYENDIPTDGKDKDVEDYEVTSKASASSDYDSSEPTAKDEKELDKAATTVQNIYYNYYKSFNKDQSDHSKYDYSKHASQDSSTNINSRNRGSTISGDVKKEAWELNISFGAEPVMEAVSSDCAEPPAKWDSSDTNCFEKHGHKCWRSPTGNVYVFKDGCWNQYHNVTGAPKIESVLSEGAEEDKQGVLDKIKGLQDSLKNQTDNRKKDAINEEITVLTNSLKSFDAKKPGEPGTVTSMQKPGSATSLSEQVDGFAESLMEGENGLGEPLAEADEYVSSAAPQKDPPPPKGSLEETLGDIDRVGARMSASIKAGANRTVNVGKAVAKPVKRTFGWINDLVSRWRDTNETKMKEKLANPYERKTLYQGIRAAVAAGSLYKAGLLFHPLFWFLAVAKTIDNKKKKNRLRNEITGEIKAEIEVINAKIADAEAKGVDSEEDRRAKYKLIRFRNEMEKKLIRVAGDRATARSI